jgi:chromosome segregation protein
VCLVLSFSVYAQRLITRVQVESMESIKLEMEDAKITWDQEVQNQKETIEAASIEQLALVEECKALRSALVSLEEEREVLKEQSFQAETELKEFDVEVQRQRQEIEVAERDLEVAKHESMRAAEITADLEDKLEKKVRELELAQQREDAVTIELRQLESRLASANSEIDDAGKQLNDVHALLTENQKERLALQQTLEELGNCKVSNPFTHLMIEVWRFWL